MRRGDLVAAADGETNSCKRPKHAPYRQAAIAAMQKAGVYDRVKDKFVLGEEHFADRIICYVRWG